MIFSKKCLNFISVLILFYYFVLYIMIQSFNVQNNTEKEQSFLSMLILIISFLILFIFLLDYFKKNYKHFIWFSFFIVYMFIYSAYYYFNKTEYITDAGIWFQFKIIIYAIFNIMLGIVIRKHIK